MSEVKRHRTAAIACTALLGPLGPAGIATLAQQTMLEEVVVTAQKREESLQDVPISITALSTEALDDIRFVDITDLTGEVPNLQIRSTAGDSTGATIAMRGTVTTNNNINFEPTVGIYLDGVFIAKNTGNLLDVVDLERVEVLRGPQGTLYGKNTMGGAINLITRRPTGEFGLSAKAGVGRFEERFGMLTVDLPAVGQVDAGLGRLSSKISYRHYQRDGWVDNEFIGSSPFAEPPSSDTFGEKDDRAARLSLVWEIHEQWTVLYNYDWSDMDRTPPFFQLTNITEDGLFDPDGALCSPAPIPGACFATTNLDSYASGDRLETGSNDRAFTDEAEVEGHAITVEGGDFDWGILGDVTLKSITAQRTTDAFSLLDLDGSNIDIASFLRTIDYEQWSQELQLIGRTDTLDYVLGLYYFTEEADVSNPATFFGYNRQLGYPVSPVVTDFGFENDAAAVYGQVDWRPRGFDRRLKISLGARMTREQKDFYKLRIESSGVVTVPHTEVDDDYDDFSPMLAASWDFADNRTVYAKIAKGFKSGAFNHGATTVDAFQIGFDSEQLISYELGLKSRWLDQRLQVNAAVFYSDYEDIQVSNFTPDPNAGIVSIIDNAGEAKISGAELELVALLARDFQLSVSYGYLNGEYTEYEVFDSNLGRVVDVKNEREFPFLVENTATVAFEYNRQLGALGELGARIAWSYIDDQAAFAENYASTYVEAYQLIAARLSLRDIPIGPRSRLGVALWGKNLADEEYYGNGIDFGAFGYTGNQFGEPRSYGLEFTYDY